jgi:hypothetical protein
MMKHAGVISAIVLACGIALVSPVLAGCWECEIAGDRVDCATADKDEAGQKTCYSSQTCSSGPCWSTCKVSGDTCTTNADCIVVEDVVICEEERTAQVRTPNGQPFEVPAPRGPEPVGCKA